MILVTHNGQCIELPDGKEVEALELAAKHCGRIPTAEEQQARDIRYAKVMADRRDN